MTAYALQKELAEEIEEVVKDIRLKSVNGDLTKLKAFLQALPKRMQEVSDMEDASEDDPDEEVILEDDPEEEVMAENPYPYCVVRVASGNLRTVQSVHQIETVLIFGIFDDDAQRQGHQVIMNMIHKVSERFIKNPVLKDKYRMNENAGISWVLDEEDRYPYYFGAMEMTWDAFFVQREEDGYV